MISIPTSQRIYIQQPNGTLHTVREGSSPFVLATSELIATAPHSPDGLVVLNSEMFRIVEELGPSLTTDKVVLMKESVIAQLLSVWYRNLFHRLRKVMYWEAPLLRWFGLKDGDLLPWWSITRQLRRTALIPEGEIVLF